MSEVSGPNKKGPKVGPLTVESFVQTANLTGLAGFLIWMTMELQGLQQVSAQQLQVLTRMEQRLNALEVVGQGNKEHILDLRRDLQIHSATTGGQ